MWMSQHFTDDGSILVGVIRLQATAWANIQKDFWLHIASLSFNLCMQEPQTQTFQKGFVTALSSLECDKNMPFKENHYQCNL